MGRLEPVDPRDVMHQFEVEMRDVMQRVYAERREPRGAMRILVTISRDWTDYDTIADALHAACQGVSFHKVTVVHGASQMDWFVAGVAHTLGMDTEPHPADWNSYGKGAGMVRNASMVTVGADICLAFIKSESRGASHCARLAEKAGIETKRYTA